MISVCMTTYNGEKFIYDQLNSILNQTLKADEVVICDDNSQDTTVYKIQNFIKENNLYEKWRVVKNKTNKGYPENFYYCMKMCQGDIVFLSDQDDIWKSDKIEKMNKIMRENQHINLLSCNYDLMDCNGNKIRSVLLTNRNKNESLTNISVQQILRKFTWPGMTMAIRSKFYKEVVGKLEKTDIPHDFILSLLAASKNSFYFYNYTGVTHRRHAQNTGKEEHRILKLLNYSRKSLELKMYNQMLSRILEADANFEVSTIETIKHRLDLSIRRLNIITDNDFEGLLKLYLGNFKKLRLNSFICDLWIMLFDKQRSEVN